MPGTSVLDFTEKENGVEFVVEGDEDAQITVGLDDDTQYEVFVDGKSMGSMTTLRSSSSTTAICVSSCSFVVH